jgi:hypothetical protein
MIFHSSSTASTEHTIQIFIQEGLDEVSLHATIMVSNHHLKCLTNEANYNEWKSDLNRIQIPPTVSHLRRPHIQLVREKNLAILA